MKFEYVFAPVRRAAAVFACVLAGVFFLLAVPSANAAGEADLKIGKQGAKLEAGVQGSLDYLFEQLASGGNSVDVAKLAPMLDFVAGSNGEPQDFEPEKRGGGKGIVLRVNLKSDMDRVLRYLYNPAIPNYLIVPSVLRLSGWYEGSDILKLKQGLWDTLPTLTEPMVLRGREFESNTPDQFGGAYYKYDLNRLLVLMKYNGMNVMISVCEQDKKSDVGRKGVIIDDNQWQYFYSGIEGLDKGLISWMDTFMYYSASIQVFVEHQPGQTRDMLFKWLNAGWSGMNVVARKHIYAGSVRFADGFRKVLESDMLPSADILAEQMTGLRDISSSEESALIQDYARAFEKLAVKSEAMDKREFLKVVLDGGYAKVLDTEDRQAVLALQKLKCLLGMDALIDMCPGAVAQAEKPVEPAASGTAQPAIQ